MQIQSRPVKTWLRATVLFILLTVVIAIAYAQSPLYTSNQNQYFLHGQAQAGIGFLRQDWLANTRDPTPVFSSLAYLTYRFLRQEALFYIFYALQMGIYLFSLLGIVSTIYEIRKSRAIFLSYLALLIVIHSAGWRLALSRVLGANWAYILEDGVADQRLLGSVFEPSTFGVFLLLSVYLFLRRKPFLAVLSAVLAATFHPTYLLSAAALTFSYIWVTFWENVRLSRAGGATPEHAAAGTGTLAGSPSGYDAGARSGHRFRAIKEPFLLGMVALVAVAPILVYVYVNFGHTLPQAAARAQDILVNFRIPYHALPGVWFDATALVKIIFVIAALFLVRKSRLFAILLICSLAAGGLTAIQILLKNNTLALIFPWRMSTFIVPLAIAIVFAWLVTSLMERFSNLVTRFETLLVTLGLVAITLAVLTGGLRFKLDLDRKAAGDERAMENYVAAHHQPGELYLTPVKLQDFRLASGSPAYVDFKSIPYQDQDLLEWYRRNKITNRFYRTRNCALLQQLSSQEGVTHVVMGSEQFGLQCPQMQSVYRDRHFVVYALLPKSP
jgi:hypothetical protein